MQNPEVTKLQLKGMNCSLCEHRDYDFGDWCSFRQGPPPANICERFELSNVEVLAKADPKKMLKEFEEWITRS